MRRQYTGLSMAPKRRSRFHLAVGELSVRGEAVGATGGGAAGSENAGMKSARNCYLAKDLVPKLSLLVLSEK